jgi:hypothetical protein
MADQSTDHPVALIEQQTDLIPIEPVDNAEGLPPRPPLPTLDDPQFGAKILLRGAVDSLYRDAAIGEQTAQMNENADVVRQTTEAIIAATSNQAAPTTKAEVYLRAMLCQLSADQHGADHLNTIRNRLGIDWMHSMAMQVANKYAAEFLPPP